MMRIILPLLFMFFAGSGRAQTPSDSAKNKFTNALVVINGIEQKKRGIQHLDSTIRPEQIESINVLKDKTAIYKYGEKGKDGVIEITTKVTPRESKPGEVKDSDSNIIFVKAEIDPSFKGGEKPFVKFLEKNLNPNVPVENGAPGGTYTVVVQFIVAKDGTISDLRALTNHGFGMEEECLRLMKLSPKWEPAIQNGRVVKAFKKQPITFIVSAK